MGLLMVTVRHRYGSIRLAMCMSSSVATATWAMLRQSIV
jgi:hypothetical protein